MPAATATAKRVMMLTSPLMRGLDVERLQTDLKLAGYLQDTVDSEFGPLTAQAVYRAKYWLGYKTPDHSAESGGLLVRLLEGKSQPSETMARLAARRKKALSAKPIGAKMLDEAFKWIGTKESPANSNNVIFSRKYGIRGPWCAMFVSCMGVTVGSKAFKIYDPPQPWKQTYAYCPYIVNDARAGKNYLTITTHPVYGDLALYDWDGDGLADHVGFFEAWIRVNQSFSSVEGNTGYTNQSNGGEVQHRVSPHERFKRNVQAFVHIGG